MAMVSIFSQGELTVGAVQKMTQAEDRALSELEKSCADRRLARKAKIVLLAQRLVPNHDQSRGWRFSPDG
jgi:hypothetical protein